MKWKTFTAGLFILSISLLFISYNAGAQPVFETPDSSKIYVVTTSDGSTFVGRITVYNSKEVLIVTKEMGEVSIPKYQVKSIEELQPGQLNAAGEYIPNEIFSTRYFITTNALPIEKGEHYVLLNIFGPEVHWGVNDNVGLGVMTSWLAIPVVFTAKTSFRIGENTNFGLGVLAGTGSWIEPEFAGILPFAALTFGDRRSNLTFSGGFVSLGYFGDFSTKPLFSVSGMTQIGKKFNFVFDSFIVLPNNNDSGGTLLMPGLRVRTGKNNSFQFAFGGIILDGYAIPVPTLGWFIRL